MNSVGGVPKRSIDWGEIHQRLSRNTDAIDEALRPSPERVKDALDERARLLARVPILPPKADEVTQVATFSLAGESYAIETSAVRKVVKLGEHTPVPGAPDFLTGVVNLQGEILAVFDLRTLFGIARGEFSERSQVIVLGVDHDEFGIVADEVHEVRILRLDELHLPPGSLEGVGRQFLRGVTREALIVLDGETLLRDDRFVINLGDDSGV